MPHRTQSKKVRRFVGYSLGDSPICWKPNPVGMWIDLAWVMRRKLLCWHRYKIIVTVVSERLK